MAIGNRNMLLEALPEPDRAKLLADCLDVQLRAGESLQSSPRGIDRIYFPTTAYASLGAPASPGFGEVMMAGFEGALGAQLAMGPGARPLSIEVEGPGHALQIEAADFARHLGHSAALRAVMHAYLDDMIQQLAISCGCMQRHGLDARLARRLLMTHDRARRKDFHATHELLACALGVRRVGITNAATRLQRAGIIAYTRGAVSVLDRAALEAASCRCYAQSRLCYSLAMRWQAKPAASK